MCENQQRLNNDASAVVIVVVWWENFSRNAEVRRRVLDQNSSVARTDIEFEWGVVVGRCVTFPQVNE